MFRPGNTYYGEFVTQNPSTGAAVNADSLPTAALFHAGAIDGSVSLTVANIETGVYAVTGTLPSTYTQGDSIGVLVRATVNGIAGKAVIDRFTLDPNGIWLITQNTVANVSSAPQGTVISSAISYATVTDMTNRFDINVLCQLVSDSGQRIATSALATNTVMLASLQAGSGRLEAAVLMGQKYQVADLVSVLGPPVNTAVGAVLTNSGQFLLDIVCGLTMCWLYDRRPMPDREVYPLMTQAETASELLAEGRTIFGLLSQAQAGITSHAIEQAQDVVTRDGVDVQAERLFGIRGNRLSTNG